MYSSYTDKIVKYPVNTKDSINILKYIFIKLRPFDKKRGKRYFKLF